MDQRFAKVSPVRSDLEVTKDDNTTEDGESKPKKMRWGTDDTSKSQKIWIIVGVVVVFLVLGILIAVLACKSKKNSTLAIENGPIMMEHMPETVPAFVGMQDPGMPAIPPRWNESVSMLGPQTHPAPYY